MASTQIEVGSEVMDSTSSKPEAFPVVLIKAVVPLEENFKAGMSSVSVNGVKGNVGTSNNKSVKEVLESHRDYRAGDLVWCQVSKDPWWPGQIYDPEDASDMALKYRRDGELLVVLFGKDWGSWCQSSQLEPFVLNFNDQMSKAKRTSGFISAVNEAVDKVSRALDSHLTCSCLSARRRDRMARLIVSNGAVRHGVFVPEADVGRLQLPNYGPNQVLSKLAGYARRASFGSSLEAGVVRSWLSAFYRANWIPAFQESEGSIEVVPLSPRDSDQTKRWWSDDDESVRDVVSSPRHRKKSKCLSPPYKDPKLRAKTCSSFKKGLSSPGKVNNNCLGEHRKKKSAEEDDEMQTSIQLSLAKARDKGETDAVSEMIVIRKQLELSSVILEKYHLKFTCNQRMRLTQEFKDLKERVEVAGEKVKALAENASLLYG